jgi:hypothetical protein
MRLHSQVMEILTLSARFIIALLENGRCSIHDKGKDYMIMIMRFSEQTVHFL